MIDAWLSHPTRTYVRTMNDKTAKKLRRLARDITIGAPDKNLVACHRYSNTLRHAECTRAMYLDMKRKHRKGLVVIKNPA